MFEKTEEKKLLGAIEKIEETTGGGLAGHLKRLEAVVLINAPFASFGFTIYEKSGGRFF